MSPLKYFLTSCHKIHKNLVWWCYLCWRRLGWKLLSCEVSALSQSLANLASLSLVLLGTEPCLTADLSIPFMSQLERSRARSFLGVCAAADLCLLHCALMMFFAPVYVCVWYSASGNPEMAAEMTQSDMHSECEFTACILFIFALIYLTKCCMKGMEWQVLNKGMFSKDFWPPIASKLM